MQEIKAVNFCILETYATQNLNSMPPENMRPLMVFQKSWKKLIAVPIIVAILFLFFPCCVPYRLHPQPGLLLSLQ